MSSAAFDCIDLLEQHLAGASLDVDADHVYYGWPGDFLGEENVVLSGTITAQDETQETKCVWLEKLSTTVYVSTAIGHESAREARDRARELSDQVQAAINATNRPPTTDELYARIKSWRCGFRSLNAIPDQRGEGWLAQVELVVTFTTTTL